MSDIRNPSATLESSTVLLSQENVDEDTSRVTYAAPRDSVEQGVHLSPEEDTAKPVVPVAIFPKDTNIITQICSNFVPVSESSPRSGWRQRHQPCRQCRHCLSGPGPPQAVEGSRQRGGWTQTTNRDDVPPRRVMTSSGRSRQLSHLCHRQEIKGPTMKSKFRRVATVSQESFRTSTATLTRTSANVSRLDRWSRSD